MNRLITQGQNITGEFIADVFNAVTIALVSVLGLLTLAATI